MAMSIEAAAAARSDRLDRSLTVIVSSFVARLERHADTG
jgi:hypothetical protein